MSRIQTAEKVDAVVVGSGAAGSIVAAKLAKAGKRVLILEAGPEVGPGDMYSSQIWARRLKWGGAPVIDLGTQPIGHGINAGWGTGGASTHHYGSWPRLHENDFDMRSRYGKGLDWPFDYAELRPYYDRVQAEVGLSGDAEAEIWRPPGDPYPMKPVPVFGQGRVITRGFEALGMRTAPAPLAVNSEVYNNRPACLYDGWCDAGCPIGALVNPQTVYLPEAARHGAELRHNACVTRVLVNKKEDRVIGVRFVDGAGKAVDQLADLVVLAAFTIQNPRLLLASASDKHPHGLANSSGLLGSHLQCHAGSTIYGLFDEYTENHMGVSTGHMLNQDGYDEKRKTGDAFGSYQWLIGHAKKPNDFAGIANTRFGLFGNELKAFLAKAARNLASMSTVIEDMPVAENRVSLSSRKDAYGVPLAEVRHNAAAETLALWKHTNDEGTRVFKAAGATEVWTGGYAALHILGGTIMGADSASSVTNGHGQTHDIANLFIAGGGLFPSNGGVNPTYTIHALGLRSAEYIVDNWSGLAP